MYCLRAAWIFLLLLLLVLRGVMTADSLLHSVATTSNTCNYFRHDSAAFASDDVVGFHKNVSSSDECCSLCLPREGCHYFNWRSHDGICTLMRTIQSRQENVDGTVCGTSRPPEFPVPWKRPECLCSGCSCFFSGCGEGCQGRGCHGRGMTCIQSDIPKTSCDGLVCDAYLDSEGNRNVSGGHNCWLAGPWKELFCTANMSNGSCPVIKGRDTKKCGATSPPPKAPPALPKSEQCPASFCSCCNVSNALLGGGRYNSTHCGWNCASSNDSLPTWCFAEEGPAQCGAIVRLDPCTSPLCQVTLPPYTPYKPPPPPTPPPPPRWCCDGYSAGCVNNMACAHSYVNESACKKATGCKPKPYNRSCHVNTTGFMQPDWHSPKTQILKKLPSQWGMYGWDGCCFACENTTGCNYFFEVSMYVTDPNCTLFTALAVTEASSSLYSSYVGWGPNVHPPDTSSNMH